MADKNPNRIIGKLAPKTLPQISPEEATLKSIDSSTDLKIYSITEDEL